MTRGCIRERAGAVCSVCPKLRDDGASCHSETGETEDEDIRHVSCRPARVRILDQAAEGEKKFEGERGAVEQAIGAEGGSQTENEAREQCQSMAHNRDRGAAGAGAALCQQQPADEGQQSEGALCIRGRQKEPGR